MKRWSRPTCCLTHHKDAKVQPGQLADGSPQEFTVWRITPQCLVFKGMQGILEEHGSGWMMDPFAVSWLQVCGWALELCCQCLHFMLPISVHSAHSWNNLLWLESHL